MRARQTITFDTVRQMGLGLPGAEEGTTYGSPALKVRGKMFACIAVHRSAEPDTLCVRVAFEDRDELLAADPQTYYLTDHYVNYPVVLVRLRRVHRDALRDLLQMGWRFVTTTPLEGEAMAVRKTKTRTTRSAKRSGRASPPKDRRKRAPATLRLRSIEPSLTVDDLDRSVRFYTGALGFVVDERYTDDEGVLRGVMLKAGVGRLGLSQDDWAKGRGRQKGVAVRIWCMTAQDVDAFAARVKAAGFTLAEEPHDQPWGGRSFAVDDPDGFHLTIYRT